ncbi:MAG: SGNH/GDSL hydrolase family protein [Chloroflexi bacterium]|nr:SGNH/GDSL hydrolase family protein [Chloroflexota bacterium]
MTAETRAAARMAAPARRLTAGLLAARLATVILAILVPLLLLEASLRLFGPWLPGNYDTGAYLVRNQELGHFHRPNFDGWIKAKEFTTHVQISPLGLRDPRTSYTKPPGTFRILLLGDSFVEAVQVQEWEGIAARLERALNVDSTRPVEIINAGVAAYGTGQELLLLEEEGRKYQPDAVVLLFFVGNDVTNNNYRLELWDSNLKLALKPYWDLEKDGTLRMIPGPPPDPPGGVSQRLRDCCVLYNVIETGVMNKLNQNYPREQLEAIGGLKTPLTGLYDTEPDGEWKRAWDISAALLAQVKERSAAMGAPLVVAGAPEWRTLEPDAWRDEIEKSNPKSNRLASGRLQIDSPTNTLGGIVADLGVPYVDLLPAFREAADAGGGPYYLEFDKHWTPAGHAVAAGAIERGLRELGLAGQ